MSTHSTESAGGRHIVLTCVGSLGDLHPYLAIAQELQRRGHTPVVATTPGFRERVETAGIEFHPVRFSTYEQPSAEMMRRVFDGNRGIEFILRELILPSIRLAYEDTCAAAAGADLLVTHPLTFATRLVAETRGLPWISTQLAPLGMSSALDPPVMAGLGWLRWLHGTAFGQTAWRTVYRLAARRIRPWLRPWDTLRIQLGLPDPGNPMFAGGRSPFGELALFSPQFAAPQPDWPAQAVATGFAVFEEPIAQDPDLVAWLDAGPPPVIFTLGSSAVWTPGVFFRESVWAARRVGCRALLLGARPEELKGFPELGSQLYACPYGSYAQIFPRGVAVVHQGGIGTTAEALRAGHPMLVVPFGVDQPDNGARVARLGAGRTLPKGRYRAARVARELKRLLGGGEYVARAAELGRTVSAENGAACACDWIEALLDGRQT